MEKCLVELYGLGQDGGLPFLKVLPLLPCFSSPFITKYQHTYKAAPLFVKQMISQKNSCRVIFVILSLFSTTTVVFSGPRNWKISRELNVFRLK